RAADAGGAEGSARPLFGQPGGGRLGQPVRLRVEPAAGRGVRVLTAAASRAGAAAALLASAWLPAGCNEVPEARDATRDRYLEMRPSPDRMVDEQGNYIGGWYSEFTGRINPEDATGDDYTFKKWLHFNIDDPAFYVVAQLVVTDIAGNAAIAVSDKATGA